MKKVQSVLKNLDSYLVALCLVVMSLSAVLQVFNRNLFKLPIAWTEELCRYAMIWMTMLGTPIGVRKGMQMSVVLFDKKIKGKALLALDLFKCVMMFAFSAIIMVTATVLMHTQAKAGQLSAALRIPMQYVSLAIFVGMLMICLYEAWEFVKLLRRGPETTVVQEGEGEQNV